MHGWLRQIPDWIWESIIVVVGLSLASIHLYHFTWEEPTIVVVVGVLVPLGLSLVVIGIGILTHRRTQLQEVTPWMTGWMLLAMVWMGIAGAGAMLYEHAEVVAVSHVSFILIIYATYGSLPGLVIGWYDGHRRQQLRTIETHEEQLERYETLVEVSGDPMYMLDDEGCITYANDALVEITGYSEEELLGEYVQKVMAEDHVERGDELIRSLLSSDEEHGTFELDIYTKSGERIPAENHLSLLYSEGEFQGSLGVLRDITDRLEREAKLQRERDRLDRFASVVSHDLRNPLNVASGRLDLVMAECESDNLEPAAQALDRMEILIDDVLTLARAGEIVGESECVDLAELIDACWRNVETKSAEVITETNAVVQADETRLQQLFENLFRNAVEHVAEDVTVTVGELQDGFYIEDDGPGIPAEEREQIFEAGYSTSDEGTGLGLSIVKEIINAHDWDIKVTDGVHGGARFEITNVEFTAE